MRQLLLNGVDVFASIDNSTLSHQWLETVRPTKYQLIDDVDLQQGISQLIPWIYEQPSGRLTFTEDKRTCCHTPYILYRRYRAFQLFDPDEIERYSLIFVMRPDRSFDIDELLQFLSTISPAPHTITLAHTEYAPLHNRLINHPGSCPRSVFDQWFAGRPTDIALLMSSFPRLKTWHPQWVSEPGYWKYWEHDNRVTQSDLITNPDLFFLNAEGIYSKILAELELKCQLAPYNPLPHQSCPSSVSWVVLGLILLVFLTVALALFEMGRRTCFRSWWTKWSRFENTRGAHRAGNELASVSPLRVVSSGHCTRTSDGSSEEAGRQQISAPATTQGSTAAAHTKQFFWLIVLVCIQCIAFLLFKVVQVSGQYTFSVASSIAITEVLKLLLAAFLHARNLFTSAQPVMSWHSWTKELTLALACKYLGLATLYSLNNQLAFWCHIFADPGTYSIFKAVTPYLVAIILRGLGDPMNQLQWVAIVLLSLAIISTQYVETAGTTRMGGKAYILLVLHVCITALASVWNMKVLKGSPVPIMIQNSLLYIYGIVLSLVSYIFLEPTFNLLATSATNVDDDDESILNVQQQGFFEGYSFLAFLLVLFQAFHGLAVSAVYKYADVLVKTFASSMTMGTLVLLSAYLFSVPLTIHKLAGVASIIVITYMYMNIATKLPKPPQQPGCCNLLSNRCFGTGMLPLRNDGA